jgi:magnesium-transporting ATPase (P-type)
MGLGDKGFRVIGIAYKAVRESSMNRLSVSVSKDDEINMTFLGLLVFYVR